MPNIIGLAPSPEGRVHDGQARSYPLSFSQAIFEEYYPLLSEPKVQHIWFCGRVSSPGFSPDMLERAIDLLMKRHEACRSFYKRCGNGSRIGVLDEVAPDVRHLDLRCGGDAEEAALDGLLRDAIQEPFDLYRAPLIRHWIARLGENQYAYIFVIHHSMCDGFSHTILIEDLRAIYSALCRDEVASLPELTSTFGETVEALNRWCASGEGLGKIKALRQELSALKRPFSLPEHLRPAKPAEESEIEPFSVGEEALARLREIAVIRRTTVNVMVMCVFAMAMARWTGKRRVTVTVFHSGRSKPKQFHLVGCFVNGWNLTLDDASDFEESLVQVKEQFTRMRRLHDVPYFLVKDAIGFDCPDDALDIVFNYVSEALIQTSARPGAVEAPTLLSFEEIGWYKQSRLLSPATGMAMMTTFLERKQGLSWFNQFSPSLVGEDKITELSNFIREILQEIA